MQEFKEGLFEVQDEGSQLLAGLVQANPGDHVLDFCAGSGGKSLSIGAQMKNKGQLYLHDIRMHALEEAKKRLKRAQIQNFQIVDLKLKQNHKLKHRMNRILLDVPCSGTGTIRRNPDMKWQFNQEKLEALVQQQKEIFVQALPYLHDEGKIIYATCSILSCENEKQVEFFIKEFDLELHQPLFKTLPQENGADGFFAAILQKKTKK